MSFTSDIRSTTRRYVAMIAQRNQEIVDFEKKYATYYSRDVFQQKRNELEKAKRDTVNTARSAVQAIVDSYKASVKDMDALNGAEVTDDAKLLTGAFKLTAADLETMYDRAAAGKGNRTMERLITDYAREHDIFIARTFHSVADKLEGAEVMKKYALNSFDRPEYADIMDSDQYFEQIIPEAVKGD